MKHLLRALSLLALIASAAHAQTITPQGRLTLTSATPVQVADVTAASTVYYDCYSGNVVPVGSSPSNLTIGSCEVSMVLAAANVVSGNVYDVFGVSDSGTLVICVGPAWSSTTARGTGAGTTELDQTNGGLWTNKNSLTHCYGGGAGTTDYGSVSAHAGTYLGSLFATANGQTSQQFAPTAASGGTNTILGLYNAYNRVPIRAFSNDSGATYTYNSATWRAARASNSNRINWLDGLKQSRVIASSIFPVAVAGATNFGASVGVDFNSTSATPGGIVGEIGVGSSVNFNVQAAGGNATLALGYNFAQAVEMVRGGTGSYICVLTSACALTLEMMN